VKKALTFIVPLRHPENARDWGRLKNILTETMRSIAAQESNDWQAVIVANHGADLPALPPQFEVKRVDFPANPLSDISKADPEQFWASLRLDKGRRILAGMLHAGEMGHIMVVDDDDFVSRRLASWVVKNKEANGWYFKKGYVWGTDAKLMYLFDDFHMFCGTSHIVRADLYKIPQKFEMVSDDYIRRMLGAHRFIKEELDASGTPLAPLPFVGAIYRVGHDESVTKSKGVFSQFFRKREFFIHPRAFCRHLMRIRPIIKHKREEFFGWKPALHGGPA